jgi:hypothetical protein
LELSRQRVRELAARHGGLARERAVVAEASSWAATCGLPEARRVLLVWLAWLRYNEGRFAEAARLHGQAAKLGGDAIARASSLFSRAQALMDDHQLHEALEVVHESLRAMASVRHPALEVHLVSTQRQIQYRLGVVTAIDEELLDIAAEVGGNDIEATVTMTEAAVAWRLNRLDAARRLAARSARAWRSMGRDHVACLPRALHLACSTAPETVEAREICERMRHSPPPPGLAVQVLGLVAMACPDLPDAREIPEEWLKALPRATWGIRREILSVEEALQRRVGG